ncbi:MAG TPA: DNA repair protein RecN [Actinomycetaceae bacterium]|nr:DNA repair protein RecN [Actinomycetaceae bacterium]
MLEELSIRGIGVIEDARLSFAPGFTVITGETGAGKTMVLTGLGLLLGRRADPALVRRGRDSAAVEAVLSSRDEVALAAVATDAGGVLDDGALLLGRVIPSEGRARATLAGRSVPTARVAEVLGRHVTVHGQSDQLRLRSAAEQRAALDDFAGLTDGFSEYREAFDAWRDAAHVLDDWEHASGRNEQERRILVAGLEAIDAVDPLPGEDDELRAAANRLTNVEDLRVAVEHALHELGAEDTGAAAAVERARRALEGVAGHGNEFTPWADALADANSVVSGVLNELGAYREDLQADPAQLERIHERRAALTSLMRSWGPGLDDVIAWAEGARSRLADLDTGPADRASLERLVAEARAEAGRRAAALTSQRTEAARRLSQAVNTELDGLAMPGARFGVSVTAAELGPFGADDVAMTLAPHPGADPLPVARSASGGELSRIMLALEVSLAPRDASDDLTMVFDEVDAGIGGSAAVEIGARLARLARTHQVIVVTHLAQVAAFADRHLVVAKTVSDSDAVTDVRPVEGAAREAELARMLGGDDSPTARRHAVELRERAIQRL